jgi:hypothetical protein
MDKNFLQNRLLTHLFFFSLFLIVPGLALVRPPGEPFFPMSRIFIQDTTANAALLGFCYLNYYLLIPRFFFARKYVLYFIIVILFLFITLALPQPIGKLFASSGGQQFGTPPSNNFPHPAGDTSFIHFILLEFRRHLSLFFTAVFFSFLLRSTEHVSKLKEEKLEAELTSLKAQINPHFLFNTLNSIYALSVKKDDRASEAIINLSGLMRYVISDANGYKIPLEKEISYIGNFIELQQARLGDTVRVHFNFSGEPGDKKITPLILITYIENAFKYGVNPDEDGCFVDITLQITRTGIRMNTLNKKVPVAHLNSTVIGMKNTSERLRHLYPSKHVLEVVENADTYFVTLSIDLT